MAILTGFQWLILFPLFLWLNLVSLSMSQLCFKFVKNFTVILAIMCFLIEAVQCLKLTAVIQLFRVDLHPFDHCFLELGFQKCFCYLLMEATLDFDFTLIVSLVALVDCLGRKEK